MNVKAFSTIKDGVMNSLVVCFVTGVLFLTITSVSPAMAHPPGDMHNPDRIVSVLKERLHLTDKQTEKIRVIFKEQDEKMKVLFEKDRERRRSEESAVRDEIDTVRKDVETQLQSVLTEEQMRAYQTLRDEEHRRMQGDHPCGGRGR